MKKHSKAKFLILSMAMTVVVMFQANVATAQSFQVGAQICVPPVGPQLQTLEYTPAGVLNTATEPRWLVCPMVTEAEAATFNSVVRLTNLSDVSATVTCIYRLNNQLGQTVATFVFPTDEPVPPGTGTSLVTANFPTDFGETLTISCNLPPNFRMVSIGIRSVL
jgi:hypothetical protein